jgi:hypothetical protein
LVRKAKRKLPRNALEPLLEMCEQYSEKWKKPAMKIFKYFLELMNKYADYFFNKPWPEDFDIAESTTLSDEDMDFLLGGRRREIYDRYLTICLKKNINIEDGFMGAFGMLWTQDALDEKFLRPVYKTVVIDFEKEAQKNKDAREILGKLKEQSSVRLIHHSLVDLVKHEHPRGDERRLIAEIFELIHTVEGLEPCGNFRCDWYQNQKYPKSNSSG